MTSNRGPSSNSSLLDPKLADLKQDEHHVTPRLSRSPHPYHRRGSEVEPKSTPTDKAHASFTTITPYHSDSENSEQRFKHAKASDSRPALSRTPSESGSDGDEEGLRLVKSLPAPPARPRKGLREGDETQLGVGGPTLLTPAQVDEEGRDFAKGYFGIKKGSTEKKEQTKDVREAEERFYRRRKAELLRRTSETLSLGLVTLFVLAGPQVIDYARLWHRGILSFCATLVWLYLLYPVRILLKPLFAGNFAVGHIHVPSAFDPAPLLYPTILPGLISLSLAKQPSSAVLFNVVLGLSAMPSPIIPHVGYDGGYNCLHWFISTIPIIASEYTAWPRKLFPSLPYRLLPSACRTIHPELLIVLYPFHRTLLSLLQHLTTTSLLSSEHELLSIALINVFCLSKLPQLRILGILLWIGGLGLLILSGRVLKWSVSIERMPNWRFQRAARVIQANNAFVGLIKSVIKSPKSPIDGDLSSPTGGDIAFSAPGSEQSSPYTSKNSVRRVTQPITSPIKSTGATPSMANGKTSPNNTRISIRGRRQTSPLQPIQTSFVEAEAPTSHQRSKSSKMYPYLTMTPRQISVRKWLYAGYIYVIVIGLILTVIRSMVSTFALNEWEPFGWAIGYLFGGIPYVRSLIRRNELQTWIPLQRPLETETPASLNLIAGIDYLRQQVIGAANTRLLLFSYWASTICIGIACVLHLSSVAEVDTRRKVFHGMMVAMLLPTTFVDPAFLSLGLALVLAVFLLLDLFRASQLQPLSKPLARFLTPYVDGRDLRGPVVVSHIFLLVGCAIPLWLALAGVEQLGSGPWEGWELSSRDVSMVAGVVCVGMGDAAASLIGRRFGRRKWPWSGGKSLEGSAAFALAVTLGLLCGKAWLSLGGWVPTNPDADVSLVATILKAAIAACGASFTEAVLTGCNDNVVVPVVLWLLVRGLDV